MRRFCEYCKDFDFANGDGNDGCTGAKGKCKIVKLDEPLDESIVVNKKQIDKVITHRCKCCGAGYGHVKENKDA